MDDIKSVQKNRGDSDTKYMNTLVEKDELMDVEVPEEVLLATRKKSPKKSEELLNEACEELSSEGFSLLGDVAVGSSSVAVGSSGVGSSSVAVVSSSVAVGSSGVGSSSVAVGSSSVAVGSSSVAVGSSSVAVGSSRVDTTSDTEPLAPLPLPHNKKTTTSPVLAKTTKAPVLAKTTKAPVLAKTTTAPEHRVVRRIGGGRDSVITYYNGSSSSPNITSQADHAM